MGRWARWPLAFVFFVLGVIGLLTPIMPQTVFFVVCFMLLSPDVPCCRRLVAWMFRKWPKVRHAVPRKFRYLTRGGPRR